MSAQPHVWNYMRETMVGTTEDVGPISQAELLDLAKSGKLKRDTLVASPTQTQGRWHPVQQIPGLLKAVESGEQQRSADIQTAAAARQAQQDEQSRQRASAAANAARISDCGDVQLVQTIHERVRGILTSTETVELIVVQKKPIVNLSPDAVVATNRRLIFYRPKLMGRFEFADYQWFDLSNAHMQQNMLGSVFTAQHTSGNVLTMDYLPKDGAMRLYRLAQEREEQARIARHEMQMNATRAGAAQINIGSTPQVQSGAAFAVPSAAGHDDLILRLQKLKALADAGLITQAEYEERKRQILEEV